MIKLRHDINREAAKISSLSSGKIAKYEYLRGKEKLLPDQIRVIEQLKNKKKKNKLKLYNS